VVADWRLRRWRLWFLVLSNAPKSKTKLSFLFFFQEYQFASRNPQQNLVLKKEERVREGTGKYRVYSIYIGDQKSSHLYTRESPIVKIEVQSENKGDTTFDFKCTSCCALGAINHPIYTPSLRTTQGWGLYGADFYYSKIGNERVFVKFWCHCCNMSIHWKRRGLFIVYGYAFR